MLSQMQLFLLGKQMLMTTSKYVDNDHLDVKIVNTIINFLHVIYLLHQALSQTSSGC